MAARHAIILGGALLFSTVTNGEIYVTTYYGAAARLATVLTPEPLRHRARELVLVEVAGKRTLAYARDKKGRLLCINEECGWPEEER